MKLSDFSKKTKSVNSAPKFILKNDAAERRHNDEITDLNTQLGFYRNIEAERDDAKRTHEIAAILYFQ